MVRAHAPKRKRRRLTPSRRRPPPLLQGIVDAYEEAIETPFLLRSGIEISWIGIMLNIYVG